MRELDEMNECNSEAQKSLRLEADLLEKAHPQAQQDSSRSEARSEESQEREHEIASLVSELENIVAKYSAVGRLRASRSRTTAQAKAQAAADSSSMASMALPVAPIAGLESSAGASSVALPLATPP